MTRTPAVDVLLEQRCQLPDGDCIEIRLAREARGLVYRLAYLRGGECLLRYEHGTAQSHLRMSRGRAAAYDFRSVEQLRYDFERDLEAV
ncbi:MAG: hypothetical protein AMJ64_11115 [Betaproteobacteria bacterium SG8_39]|nr:MAG: hypothetical protein AMJ64_11115 [Betaproteobacteria bacterium SG8_39]